MVWWCSMICFWYFGRVSRPTPWKPPSKAAHDFSNLSMWMINIQYCSRRSSIAYPGWLNLLQFEWFSRVVPKKLGAVHKAATRFFLCSRRTKCDLKRCLHQGGVQLRSCTGTFSALHLSQQILPSIARIERAVTTLNRLNAQWSGCALNFDSFSGNLYWFFVSSTGIQVAVNVAAHESTRQEACWKGENLRRNPCKSYAFDSVVLCDVLSDQG